MSRFNLIDEKWIPVRFSDGSRDELGIRDTLLRSREIAAIEDPSPLVVGSLHRLLLALLYRALEGPTDIDQAKVLFKEGFPEAKILAYLEKWRERFWLFDKKHPFYQIPDFEPNTWRAWTALATEHNADNAKVLFDHADVCNPGSISEAAATRWMLATQTFSVSCGKSELAHTKTAPSATSVLAIPIGHNLRDTLLFSLVPQNMEIMRDDYPVWERDPESMEALKDGFGRNVDGLSDLYTWRIRSVRLKETRAGKIDQVAFASGVDWLSEQIDPMLGYKIVEKKGKLPIQFRERGFWRDFDSLLPDDSRLSPLVIEHAAALTKSCLDRFPKAVTVLGQLNDKAKIEFWRMELFTLPTALLGDHFIRHEIHCLLSLAEKAQKSLWSACRTFARNLLSRGDREPAGKDIDHFIEQMAVIHLYWSKLEARFHDILKEYNVDQDFDEIRKKWLIDLQYALERTWDEHRATAATGDAWTIRALVKAEGAVRRKLKELREEIMKIESMKEGS